VVVDGLVVLVTLDEALVEVMFVVLVVVTVLVVLDGELVEVVFEELVAFVVPVALVKLVLVVLEV